MVSGSMNHVPFTDRLSPALKRLSAPKFTASTPLKRLNGHHSLKNGKIHKPLKLRAALDKSTIAWSSTTKTRPKASLLDQLNSLAKELVKTDFTEIRTEIPSVYKDTTLKNTTPAQKKLWTKSPDPSHHYGLRINEPFPIVAIKP